MKNICIVCEYGWIIIGNNYNTNEEKITLKNASIVRKWVNGRGIGGIAKEKYKNEYILDEIGEVEIYKNKVLFEIPCEW